VIQDVHEDEEGKAAGTDDGRSETGLRRRHLLGAAAAGFAWAASGLYGPEALVTPATAADRPAHRVQKHKEQRREKRRQERDRQRHDKQENHGAKGNDKAPRGGDHQRWIEIYLYNDRPVTTPNGSASVTDWGWDEDERTWHGVPITLPNGHVVHFQHTGRFDAGVVIDGRYNMFARNDFILTPRAFLNYGGTMTTNGNCCATRVLNEALSVNEVIAADIEGHHFVLKRLADNDDFKVFEFHFS
jgi:hypothetical protein